MIQRELSKVNKYYFKGWSENIGHSNYQCLGALTFDDITLPTANQALQISSSSSSDTSISVLVLGLDSSFNVLQEVVNTDATDGQTTVNLTNSYFRINQMRIVSTTGNVGDLYLSKQSSSTTNGVPDNQRDYIYSMRATDVVGTILNGCVPPLANGYLIPNYVVFSLSNTNKLATICFQMKKTNSSLWGTEFMYHTNKEDNKWEWKLNGVADIPNNDMSYGYDVRMMVKKNSSGGNFNGSSSLSIYTGSF